MLQIFRYVTACQKSEAMETVLLIKKLVKRASGSPTAGCLSIFEAENIGRLRSPSGNPHHLLAITSICAQHISAMIALPGFTKLYRTRPAYDHHPITIILRWSNDDFDLWILFIYPGNVTTVRFNLCHSIRLSVIFTFPIFANDYKTTDIHFREFRLISTISYKTVFFAISIATHGTHILSCA